jgi:uncharacterized protein (TIGR02466 family)
MNNKHQIHTLFPTAVYTNNIPDKILSPLTPLLDNEKRWSSFSGQNEKSYGERSKNTYILNKEKYSSLTSFIINEITNFASNILGYQSKEWRLTQSWITYKQPGQQHIPHNHPYSLISGVFYFGEFGESTPHLSFHRKDEFIETFHINNKMDSTVLNPYNTNTYNIPFKPNMLILFPSSLMHSVSPNQTKIPRKGVAFNSIPLKGLGMTDTLTELKF